MSSKKSSQNGSGCGCLIYIIIILIIGAIIDTYLSEIIKFGTMLLTTVGIILGLVFAVKIISALVKFFHKIHLQKKQAAEISVLNEMQSLNIAAMPGVEEMPPKTELLDSSSISSADLTELADKTILNSEVNHYYVDNITADNYFIEAGELVTDRQRASVGHLQRALRIGFDRANINTTPSDNVELESLG